MVGFSEYFESVIHQKPEWRKAFVDYDKVHRVLLRLGLMTHEINVMFSTEHQQQQQQQNNNNNIISPADNKDDPNSATYSGYQNIDDGNNPVSNTSNLRRSFTAAQTPSLTVKGQNLLFPSNQVLRSRTMTPAVGGTFSPGSNDGETGAGIVFPSEVSNNNSAARLMNINRSQERITPGSRSSTAPPPRNLTRRTPTSTNVINKPEDMFPVTSAKDTLRSEGFDIASSENTHSSSNNDISNLARTTSPFHHHHHHTHSHDYRKSKSYDDLVKKDRDATGMKPNRQSVKFHDEGVTYYDEFNNEIDNDDPEQRLLQSSGANATCTPGSLSNDANNTRRSRTRWMGGTSRTSAGGQPLTTTPFTTFDGAILNDGMVVEELFNTSGAEKAQRIKQDGFDKLQESSAYQPASMEEIAKELFRLFKLREKAMEDDMVQEQLRENTLLNQQLGSTQVFNNNNSLNNSQQGFPSSHSANLTSGLGRENSNAFDSARAIISEQQLLSHQPSTPQVDASTPPGSQQKKQQQVSPNKISGLSLPQSSQSQQREAKGGSVRSQLNDIAGSSMFRQPSGSNYAESANKDISPYLGGASANFPIVKRNTTRSSTNNNNDDDQQQQKKTSAANSNQNLLSDNSNSSSTNSPHLSNKAIPVPSKFHKKGTSPLQSSSLQDPVAISSTVAAISEYGSKNNNNNKHQTSPTVEGSSYQSRQGSFGLGNTNKPTSSPSIQPLSLPPGITTKDKGNGNPVQEYSPQVGNQQRRYNNTNSDLAARGDQQNSKQQTPPLSSSLNENSMSSYGSTSIKNNNNNSSSPGAQQQNKKERLTLHEKRKGGTAAAAAVSSSNPPSAITSKTMDANELSPKQQQQQGTSFTSNTSMKTKGNRSPNEDNQQQQQQSTGFNWTDNFPQHHASATSKHASGKTSPVEDGGSAQFPPSSQPQHLMDRQNSNSNSSGMIRQNSASARQQQFQSGVVHSHHSLSRRPSTLSTLEVSNANNNNNNLGQPHQGGPTSSRGSSSQQISPNFPGDNQQFPPPSPDDQVETFPAEQVTYIDVFNMCIDLIQQNAAKASHFAEVSQQQLVRYFEEHQQAWKEQGEDHDPSRCRTHLRYLHHELTSLSAFVEANKLCVIKLIREFQSATDHLIIDDEEEELLAEEPDEVLETLRLEACEDVILSSVREVEAFFALKFCGGNIGASKKMIQTKMTSSRQAFRAGFLLALCIATLLYWCHVFFELGVTDATQNRFKDALPVMRFCHVLAVAFLCWSGVLWMYDTYSINYLYVLELDNIESVTWQQMMEYSLLLGWLVLFLGIMFVRSTSQQDYYASSRGFESWTPVFIPAMFFIFALLIIIPVRRVMRQRTAKSFWKIMWGCIKLPLGYVTFAQFFVADWGTSLPTTLGDLLYSLCYLGTYFKHLNQVHDSSLPSMDQCVHVHLHWGNLVAMIPFYWRACQTLKMFLRTENRVHLLNHGKYITCLIAITFELLATFYPDSKFMKDSVWVWHTLKQIYCWVWDVLFDWGHIGWFRGKSRKWLLPEDLYWTYYAAILLDFFGRFWYIISDIYFKPLVGSNWAGVVGGDIEVARRAMWSIYRIENENTNNLETYRSIDFVPKVSLPPQDTFF